MESSPVRRQTPRKPISVLLVDDHMVVREGVRALLKLEEDIRIVGEANDGRRAVALTREFSPDVVLMDLTMPLLNGMEATRQILAVQPTTRVLIFSAHSDNAHIDDVVAHGAAGYLVKEAAATSLPLAIRTIAAGKSFFSSGIRNPPAAPSDSRRHDHYTEARVRLTSRETEVLQLVAEGLASKQIAAELEISVKTVEKHRHNLMNKLGIRDIAGLTRHALAAGIIESGVSSAKG